MWEGPLGFDFFPWDTGWWGRGLWAGGGYMDTSGNRNCQWASRNVSGFHRERVDYLTRQFVPKWASPNAERVLKTAGTASLLVDFIGVTGWLCDGGLHEEFQDSRINIKLDNVKGGICTPRLIR